MTGIRVGVFRAVVLSRFPASDVETVFVQAEPQIGASMIAEFAGWRAVFDPNDFLFVHIADNDNVRAS